MGTGNVEVRQFCLHLSCDRYVLLIFRHLCVRAHVCRHYVGKVYMYGNAYTKVYTDGRIGGDIVSSKYS